MNEYRVLYQMYDTSTPTRKIEKGKNVTTVLNCEGSESSQIGLGD